MKKRRTLIYTILLGSSLLVYPLRSTAQEKKMAITEEKATVPLYQGTYVGLDVFGLGSKIFGSDFTSAEVSVEVNLKNRFIPIVATAIQTRPMTKPIFIIRLQHLIFVSV